jgi:hypothetical protein
MASSTPTIYPGPSPLPGCTVQPLWFRSEPFIEDARADVAELLATFEVAWEARPQGQSPFQVFRQAWRQQGWDRVHLAIVDATLRPDWIDSMARLMLGAFLLWPVLYAVFGSSLRSQNDSRPTLDRRCSG